MRRSTVLRLSLQLVFPEKSFITYRPAELGRIFGMEHRHISNTFKKIKSLMGMGHPKLV
jgi:hypothetical protein